METIGDLLRHLVESYGPRPALRFKVGKDTQIWTFTELADHANRATRWMQAQGVEKGDRVIIWAPNGPWWVAAYFGALRMGAVVVPLDVRSGPDFAERVIGQTTPTLALLSKTTAGQYSGLALSFMLEDIDSLMTDSTPADLPPVSIEDIAALMFTSGATGDPKGVILTQGNIMADVLSTDKVVPEVGEFRLVSLLPLSHVFEQTVGLLLALKRGASVYYISSLLPATIFEALKEQKATAMLLVPGALQLFMSSIEREVAKQGKEKQWKRLQAIAGFMPTRIRRLLFKPVYERLGGHLEFLVSGGAPIAPELVRKWELLGIPVLQGYGATESSGVISATNLRDRNFFTVGNPIPGMQIKLAEDGEVLIKGPSVTPGYWKNEKATEAAFEDGWYKTGDLGEFEKNGHLHLHGRKKDLIVLANGQNVYPEDVERAIKGVAGVVDTAVVGMPAESGTEVYAVLILDQSAPEPDAIIRDAHTRLAPHQFIKGYTVWPDQDFPRTHTLKVKKHEVLASILAMQKKEQQAKAAAVAGAR